VVSFYTIIFVVLNIFYFLGTSGSVKTGSIFDLGKASFDVYCDRVDILCRWSAMPPMFLAFGTIEQFSFLILLACIFIERIGHRNTFDA